MNIAGVLSTSDISPYSRICQVPLRAVQQALIEVFKVKGMPGCFRVDNGEPFGDPRYKMVSPISLWLIGSGVNVLWNPPRSPKSNPKVERGQRTSKNWADIFKCLTYQKLQANLDTTAEFQRTKYKVRRLGYKTRAQAFPGLTQLGRPYGRDNFEINTVYQYLGHCTFARRISKVGQIRFYNHVYYIDWKRKYQPVYLKFLPESIQWEVISGGGEVLKTIDTPNFQEDRIRNLTVCQRTK